MRVYVKSLCLAAGIAGCGIAAEATGFQAVALGSGASVERVIEDPHSGRRWVLAKDPEHRGGPGTLVEQRVGEGLKPGGTPKANLVIRAGDRVLVEENTRVARGLFDATALSTARLGASFRVRLRVGGRVVWATATGPGRAALAGRDEAGQ